MVAVEVQDARNRDPGFIDRSGELLRSIHVRGDLPCLSSQLPQLPALAALPEAPVGLPAHDDTQGSLLVGTRQTRVR